MVRRRTTASRDSLDALKECLDERAGLYERLRGASNVADYLAKRGGGADEEVLTEPILGAIIERVLGFPRDAYFQQLGKAGKKPDFTPHDLIAHPFVLDAKSSEENLGAHEPQIRGYMEQRKLDYGILFNLREARVYRRGRSGHDAGLSFPVLALWQFARGEALPVGELERFEAFCARFAHQQLTLAQKIAHVATRESWASRLAAGEAPDVDVEFLVERLRLLSRELADDAGAQTDLLDGFVRLNPSRERRLLQELGLLALDIAPGADLENLPRTISAWRTGEGLPARVWRQYLLRVAYLAVTRIVLYRAWEDVQFVDEYLHDGGFDLWYDRLAKDVVRVLQEAFLHGQQQYPWLYGRDNNYDWYRPRKAALVEVLYSLAPIPLGRLDADVLGALYESYVDGIDRDRLGQFFTPRAVVRFMLDRAGFKDPKGVFRIEGDERKPRQILDFATGSGGFLVEAARRIIDEGGIDLHDPRALREALGAIVGGFVGGEISPFPYYLTEVNVLLQVSRLLGLLRVAEQPVTSFGALGVLHVDTLTAKSAPDRSLDEFDPKLRADRAELVRDERFDLVPLDGEKLETFRSRLRQDGLFDLIVGNPPYVTEANNKPLFDRLRAIPAWRGIYRGKTDYLYYFLLLAVEKLAPGGRLCVITPAGWMNAGAANFLRARLASELRLDELFLFGSYRLFATEGQAPTPTVESAILVATKAPIPEGHTVRVVALEDESGAPSDREALLDEMRRRARGKPGRRGGIHVHDVPQSALVPERPWPVKHAAGDIAARVVAHLQGLLDDEASPVERLANRWSVFQGIKTAADAYSARLQKRLSAEVRQRLHAAGARTGDPILELPAGLEKDAPWRGHPELLARSPEPRAILYGAIDDEDYVSLVWIGRGAALPADVREALDPWQPVLETRFDILSDSSRGWWEAARPRDRSQMSAPKVIALYRTDRGRFALDETGEWQPSIKMTLAVGREPDAPVAYLCGLLNSELLDLWYAVRGKTPRHVWRNYEPLRMNEMPYRRPEGDPRVERVAELVRAIAANRRALLPHRSVVRDLARIVKDPWKTGPVEIDRAALIAELPPADTVSVRLDPSLEVTVEEGGRGRPMRKGDRLLVLRRGRVETARVTALKARLDLLEEVLGGRPTDSLLGTLLPLDVDAFERLVRDRSDLVSKLLAEGRRLVEEVERLVCSLYDVPDDLANEVVQHAIDRSVRETG